MLKCPICEQVSERFKPLPRIFFDQATLNGFNHPIDQWETFNYTDYECPFCGVSDRERLYALFLLIIAREAGGSKLRLLDFAPSKTFQQFVTQLKCFEYRTADLFVNTYDDVVDIKNMHQYPDNYFDCFICSHVLEHVPDDSQALKELFRILKPSGFGIIMSPISLFYTTTYEDFSQTTEAQRWKHFGQGDHVRVYSRKDFTNKIKEAGFNLRIFDHQFFGEDLFIDSGISSGSTLYVGEKL
jgi:predicted SAM-dependent methyltransferase